MTSWRSCEPGAESCFSRPGIGQTPDVFNPPPHLRITLPSEATTPRTARKLISQLIDGTPSASFLDAALLMTSEIVTNAARLGGDCEMSAWFMPDEPALRVEVSDSSPAMPHLLAPRRPEDVTGRGLQIVDELATHWGVTPLGRGKSVWFELSP
jgi:hypothetical protein